MAYSSTVNLKSVFGNARMAVLSCVADAASGNVSGGGLGYLFAAALTPVSMATAAPRVKLNSLEAGTAAVGSVGLSGLVSGDVFYLTLYGRS
jgi:hypothetical protein